MELILAMVAGIVIGLAASVVWLNHNLSSRPEWVMRKMASFADDLEPVEDWYRRINASLLMAAEKLKAARNA